MMLVMASTLSHCISAGLGGHGGNALHVELAGGDVEVDGGGEDASRSEDAEGYLHILHQPGSVLGGLQLWPLLCPSGGVSCTPAVLLLPVLREEDRERSRC